MHFIQLLVEKYPEPLARREFLEYLWPNQEISDATLAQILLQTIAASKRS